MDQFVAEFWIWTAWAWSYLSPIVKFLAAAGITVGVATAAAYAAFKVFATKWLDNKFSERLEKLKHKINSNFDRLRRVNDREFETLPEIWGKLVECQQYALGFVSVMQQHANIRYMDDEALTEFLDTTKMANWQKREVLASSSKQEVYIKIQQRYRHADMMDRLRDLDITYNKYRIFIWPDLKPKITEMIQIIHKAIQQQNMYDEHTDMRPRERTAAETLEGHGSKLMEEIELMVTNRLWDSKNQAV